MTEKETGGHKIHSSLKEQLEIKKLELEIQSIKPSYFWRTIFPIMLQALFGVLIAAGSIYTLYWTNSMDAKNNNIDAKTAYDRTILETIRNENRSNDLKGEIREFEHRKQILQNDSLRLVYVLDSMNETSLI